MRILVTAALILSATCVACVGSAEIRGIKTSPDKLEFVWDAGADEVDVGTILVEVFDADEMDSVFLDIQHSPELRLTINGSVVSDVPGIIELHSNDGDYDGSDIVVHRIRVFAKTCHDVSQVSIQHVGLTAFGNPPLADPKVIPVRRVELDPDPDPGTPPTRITSSIATIRGHDTYVQGGVPRVFLTGFDSNGNGRSEIHNLQTGALEHTFATVPGRDGTVACTPDGKLFFTVLIDDGTGFVRFETFDAATDNAYVSQDFVAAQWIMGAARLPFVPVLLDKAIFTAPGAEFDYDVLVTSPGPVIEGDPTVQPWVPASTVSTGRRQRRGVAVDRRGQDVLAVHWNSGEDVSVMTRRESAPTDNPANFFAPILTIPATTNELRPFGDSLLAWKTGETTGYLYRRDGSGDLTTPDGTLTLPADIIDSDSGTMTSGEIDRAFFLVPGKIVELTVPEGTAASSREIALPTDKGQPIAINVIDVGGKESAVVLFEDGIEVIDLGSP